MQILSRLDEPNPVGKPMVLTMGFFDGVHRGHQSVIGAAITAAERVAGSAWLLTFNPHPLKIIKPESAPALLTSISHKLGLLEKENLAGCYIVEFTQALRETSPAMFIEDLCRKIPALTQIIVGERWVFGRRGAGSTDSLRELAAAHDVAVQIVPPVNFGGQPISSTRIRQAVQEGALDLAAEMLGRPYSVHGDVVEGAKVGRELGFPTANIDPHNEAHPPDGIYAAYTYLDGQPRQVAAYVGRRPSMPSRQWVVEAHIIDGTDYDLYGKQLELFFVQKVRDDTRFASHAELKDAITADVKTVREILKTKSGKT